MKYYIYLTKNNFNGKIYIGKRKCPINKTPLTDPYMGSGFLLKRAIKKYGIKFFEKKILCESITDVKLLNTLEKFFIETYNSTKREIGYNRTIGGDGGCTTIGFSDEEMNEYKNKLKSKKHTEETKQKLREKVDIVKVKMNLEKARKKYAELIESGWRQNFSDETRKKMSKSGIGKRVKKVLCIETNITYDSMQEAAKLTNSSISKISLCCHGKRNKTNNFHWKFI